MSRRDHVDQRCPDCLMYACLCICALVPRLQTRTRLTVMVHVREARKPTNTGQLAARIVANSVIERVGAPGATSELGPVADEVTPLLLFPADDAVPIERYAASERPVALYVPDGNWRQASKMRRRRRGLDAMTCVSLPDAGATEYRLRAEAREGGLATLEAIARALGILEGERGPAIEAAMIGVFRVMVDRTLWLRGQLRDAEVTDGVPAAALAQLRPGRRQVVYHRDLDSMETAGPRGVTRW